MKKLLLIAASFALIGCDTMLLKAESPEQRVFATTSAYGAALTLANAYKALPECTMPNAPKLCAHNQVIQQVQTADKVTYEALTSAQKIVRDQGAHPEAKEVATTWAKEAVVAFQKIVSILKVK